MFCNQCEQTARGSGCTVKGVCGKNDSTAHIQDGIVEAVRIGRKVITMAAQSDPAFALHLLGIVSLRLRMYVKKLSNQGVSANRRVCRYILHRVLIEQNTRLVLRVGREEMANMLGIARETLSRVLSRLVNEGVLAVKGCEVNSSLRGCARWRPGTRKRTIARISSPERSEPMPSAGRFAGPALCQAQSMR